MLRRCFLMIPAFVLLAPGVSKADHGVPFKGDLNATAVAARFDPSFPFLHVIAVGSGQATHLGQYTAYLDYHLNVLDGTYAGQITFTAANGDQLHALFAGYHPTPTTLAGGLILLGGTGRFVNASGSAGFTGSDPIPTEPALHFDGTILLH
jgi:hypothetical protein